MIISFVKGGRLRGHVTIPKVLWVVLISRFLDFRISRKSEKLKKDVKGVSCRVLNESISSTLSSIVSVNQNILVFCGIIISYVRKA